MGTRLTLDPTAKDPSQPTMKRAVVATAATSYGDFTPVAIVLPPGSRMVPSLLIRQMRMSEPLFQTTRCTPAIDAAAMRPGFVVESERREPTVPSVFTKRAYVPPLAP